MKPKSWKLHELNAWGAEYGFTSLKLDCGRCCLSHRVSNEDGASIRATRGGK